MFTDEKKELPTQIDLNELAKRHDLRIVVEPQEPQPLMRARLASERLDAAYRRRKDWLLFRVTLFAAVTLGMVCVLVVLTNGPGKEFINLALATLTSLVTGAIGYLSGKSG